MPPLPLCSASARGVATFVTICQHQNCVMELFNVSCEEKQLVLAKQQPSQLVRLALLIGVVIFFGLGLWSAAHEPLDFHSSVTLSIFIIYFPVAVFYAGWQLFSVINGETWVFDAEEEAVIRNGKSVGTFNEIYSVRVWEESDGESTTRRLALQPTGSKPLIISDALNDREWNELVETAQQISAFTGIKIVHK